MMTKAIQEIIDLAIQRMGGSRRAAFTCILCALLEVARRLEIGQAAIAQAARLYHEGTQSDEQPTTIGMRGDA